MIKKSKNLLNSQKFILLVILSLIIITISITLPTLARYQNRVTLLTAKEWDGTTSSSYKKGTGSISDPYVISSGSELMHFYNELLTNNYENKYFILNNDIVLNKGVFEYDNKIKYILNNTTYYVDPSTNKYYDNDTFTGTEVGLIHSFNPLNTFKGYLDGKSYTIYGLYINSDTENIGLFKDLEGSISNLYIDNAFIKGGNNTGLLASNTLNANIKNVFVDGIVIGNTNITNKDISIDLANTNFNISTTELLDNISLANTNHLFGSEIISSSLTGNYVINNGTETNTTIKINNETVSGGTFNINLGTDLLNQVSISLIGEDNTSLSITNLKYNLTYKYGISGGLIALASNTTLENIVNKANVLSSNISGGLIGISTNNIITNSYNNGTITSNYSGGLVGLVDSNTTTINSSYNVGTISSSNNGGLVSTIIDSTVNINDSFDISNYAINKIDNATITIDNSYTTSETPINIGTTTGNFIETTTTNLKSKSYIQTNLLFNEFISINDLNTNPNNIWVFEDNYPILYIDDVKGLGVINASIYSWNNFTESLNSIKINSNISFSISPVDELKPIKNIYYYISNTSTPLTKLEVENITTWTEYSSVVNLTTEGFYTIYAKLIDYNDNVTYINSDMLILDLSGSIVKATTNSNEWTTLKETPNNFYINKSSDLLIEAIDNLSGIEKVEYYITNQIVPTATLEALNDSIWTTYVDKITIPLEGKNIIYIKVTDNCGFVTYINTDFIIYDGYIETMSIGRDLTRETETSMTDKSLITYKFTYNNSLEVSNTTHNLISNILFPQGTNITLIDNKTNKIYRYTITTSEDIYNYNNSCSGDCKFATYPLTLFTEIGTLDTSNYVESSYFINNETNEEFKFIIDFNNTNIVDNLSNIKIYMNRSDSASSGPLSTLDSSIKSFNIYKTINEYNTYPDLTINSDFNETINLNVESETNINVTSILNYKKVSDLDIIDTRYDNQNINLLLYIVDTNGDIITKDKLKSIVVKVDNKLYYPSNDNMIHVTLNNGLNINKVLTFITYSSNNELENGDYYLKIKSYASFNGYISTLDSDIISINLKATDNNYNIDYLFSVLKDETKGIINKSDTSTNLKFDILENGNFSNPNVRVSLYKKTQNTAYNQEYTLVDLQNFVSNQLTLITTNSYYAKTSLIDYNGTSSTYNHFELDLINNNFENTGYKLAFELYDGNRKIGTINSYFVIK